MFDLLNLGKPVLLTNSHNEVPSCLSRGWKLFMVRSHLKLYMDSHKSKFDRVAKRWNNEIGKVAHDSI